MTNTTYLKYEMIRTSRSIRFLVFSLGFPLVMFFVIAGPHRHEQISGVSFVLYYMCGMTAWGSMMAVMSAGGRIAAERQVGWHRQLRVTPMKTQTYFLAKVVTGYVMALLTMTVIFASASALGVRLSITEWLTTVLLVLVGLIPFAVLGIFYGHLLNVDSLGPALGGTAALFGVLGGVWGPIADSGVMHQLATDLPSYWLTQAGGIARGGGVWPLRGWVVIALWSVILAAATNKIYQRDTAKV